MGRFSQRDQAHDTSLNMLKCVLVRKILLGTLLLLSLSAFGWVGYVFVIPSVETAVANAQRHSERESKDSAHNATVASQVRALRTKFLLDAGGRTTDLLTQQAQQRTDDIDWLRDSLKEHGDGYRSRRAELTAWTGKSKALVTVEEYSAKRAQQAVDEGTMGWIKPWQAQGAQIGVYATWHDDKLYCVSIIA